MTDQAKEPPVDPDRIRREALTEAAAIARQHVGQFRHASWAIPEVIAEQIEQLDCGESDGKSA